MDAIHSNNVEMRMDPGALAYMAPRREIFVECPVCAFEPTVTRHGPPEHCPKCNAHLWRRGSRLILAASHSASGKHS
jgi:hypothetical protein